jgi:hypothetical protein
LREEVIAVQRRGRRRRGRKRAMASKALKITIKRGKLV